MKHVVKPFMDQSINQAIDRNDSQAAATAIELQFPKTFSRRAWRVIRYMEGAIYLYSYKGKFVANTETVRLIPPMAVPAGLANHWRNWNGGSSPLLTSTTALEMFLAGKYHGQ